MRVKFSLAVRTGDAESVTVAVKPPVPEKVGAPEMTPVFASMASPSTKRVVGDIRAILQCSAPWPLTAASFVE